MDRKFKILIVDKHANLIELIKDRITAWNKDIEMNDTGNGEKAKELIDSFNPDLILLAQRLNDCMGTQILEYLKENSIAITVFMVTAEDIKDEALKLGAKKFIRKPFDFDDLIEEIKTEYDNFNR